MNKFSKILFSLAMLFGLSTSYNIINENNQRVVEAAATTAKMTSFTATSGNVGSDANVTYSAAKGGGTTAPAIYSNKIRLYQNSNGTGGGYITIETKNDNVIKSITIGSSSATSVAYSEGIASDTKSASSSIDENKTYTYTATSAVTSVTFHCMGKTEKTRLNVNSLSVTYDLAGGISAVPATSISLNPTTLTLTEGSTADLTATVLPDDTTDTVQWGTNNEKVASVNNGKVTANGVGSATITATAGTVSAACTVEVTAIPLPEGQHISKITPDNLAATNTEYTSFTYTDDYGTAYKGKTARNSNNNVGNIQLNDSSPNGIVVSANGNYAVRSIIITWSTKTTNGRTIAIYGNYKAYSGDDASDLYNYSSRGVKLGTLTYSSTANTTVSTLNVTDNYKYIGIRASDGALYVEEISIIWEEATFEPVKLATPTNYTYDYNTKTVSWDAVENATSYAVKVINENLEEYANEVLTTNSYTFPSTAPNGEYYLTVVAKPEHGSTRYLDSDYSESAVYTVSFYTSKDVVGIDISEDPTTEVKIIYNLGEVFDPTGLVVTGKLPDKTRIDITNEIEWPTEQFTTVGEKTITVKFNGLSATWNMIEVIDPLPTDFAKVKTQTNLKFDYTRSTTTTSYGQDETITMSSFYSSVREDLDVTTETQVYSSSLSISFDKGTGTPPKYYANGNALRFYTNNTATVTVAEGVKSLVVTCSSDSYASALAKSTYTDATFNYKTGTNYVTINPTSRQFTIQGGGSQARIVSIEVQYSSTSVVTYKEFTNVQMQFKYDFDLSTYYTDHVSETGIMLTKDSTFTFDSDCITEEDFAEYQEAYGLAKSVNTTQKSTYKVAIDIPLDAESVRTNIYACAYIVVDGTYYFATEASNGTARGYSLASLLDAYGTNSELTTEQTQIVASLKEFIYSL